MMELVAIKTIISSREIARLTGKIHENVMAARREIESTWKNVTGSNFRLSEYKDSIGRKLPIMNI